MKRAALLLVVLLAGCPEPAPSWHVAAGSPGGVVLSLWGASPKDVYVVGGPLGNAGGHTVAMHYDGAKWHDLAPGGTETYWWVAGTGPTDVWFAGEQGRITHWDGQSARETPSGVTATIWGLWAAAPDDAWAVGGTPDGGMAKPNDIVLHWNGTAWAPEPLPGAPRGLSLFKVWGASASELFVVGEGGVIWHRKAGVWTADSDPTPLEPGRLTTVYGCSATDVYAVGNLSILHYDGQSWSKDGFAPQNILNGVTCAGGEVAVVGFGGVKLRRTGQVWLDDSNRAPLGDLHGVWSDGAGSIWTAGGDFVTAPRAAPRTGVVARYGTSAPPGF